MWRLEASVYQQVTQTQDLPVWRPPFGTCAGTKDLSFSFRSKAMGCGSVGPGSPEMPQGKASTVHHPKAIFTIPRF